MPDSYSNIIFGGKCIYVVDELVGWLVWLLMDTPRLDHVSCGHRRAHRCQSIILSAASDLKWPLIILCGQTALITVQQLKWTRGGVIGASVIILFRASQMVKWSTINHAPSSVEFHFFLRQLVWRSSLHRLRAFNACAKRGVSVFSLYKIPLHPGPPVGAVATELPTHSNSAAHDKPAPRARTCRTWVNKRIRAKPVNCGQQCSSAPSGPLHICHAKS